MRMMRIAKNCRMAIPNPNTWNIIWYQNIIGGAAWQTWRQDQLCLFKVFFRQWVQLNQVPFGDLWFKVPHFFSFIIFSFLTSTFQIITLLIFNFPIFNFLIFSFLIFSSSVGLTGQRGRQGRDRANLLAPVSRYLSKTSTWICQNYRNVFVKIIQNVFVKIIKMYLSKFSTYICQNEFVNGDFPKSICPV